MERRVIATEEQIQKVLDKEYFLFFLKEAAPGDELVIELASFENKAVTIMATIEEAISVPDNILVSCLCRKTGQLGVRDRKPKMAIFRASFHDETWYKCPHCGHGVEVYSFIEKDGKTFCPYCSGEVTFD